MSKNRNKKYKGTYFICGNFDLENVTETKFQHIENICMQSEKFKVVHNPFKIKPLFGLKRPLFRYISLLVALFGSYKLILLPNWQNSRECRLYVVVAILLGKGFIYSANITNNYKRKTYKDLPDNHKKVRSDDDEDADFITNIVN